MERRIRRLQVLAIASMVVAGAALGWRAGSRGRVEGRFADGLVEAERFVLRDAKGKQRGVWEVDKHGTALLRIAFEGGAGATLGEATDGPFLSLHGSTHAVLSAQPDTAQMTLWGVPRRQVTDADLRAIPDEQAKLAIDFCRMGTNGNQLILQTGYGRADLDAGTSLSRAPWMTMAQNGKIRLAIGNGFWTGDKWRQVFKNTDGSDFFAIPPTPPPP